MRIRLTAAAALPAAGGAAGASGPLTRQVEITNMTSGHYDCNNPVASVAIRRMHGHR